MADPTTADLIARTRDLLAEEGTGDLFDDNTDILPALNDGIRRMFAKLDVLPTLLTPIDVDAGTASYTPDAADPPVGRWIALKHDDAPLAPITMAELMALVAESGPPRSYVPTLAGFTVHPTPSADLTDGFTGAFFAVPVAIDLETVDPTWHPAHAFTPCYYAASILLRKDKLAASADSMLALFYQAVREYGDDVQTAFPDRVEERRPSVPAGGVFGELPPYLDASRLEVTP